MSDQQKHLVILGVGLSAISLIKGLAPVLVKLSSPPKVTLISEKNYYIWNVATPRALTDIEMISKIIKPLKIESITKHNGIELIYGRVEQVNEHFVTVQLIEQNETKRIDFDYAVVAFGSSYVDGPFKSPEFDLEKEKTRLTSYYNDVKESKNILVIGGGATGIEVAADIADGKRSLNFLIIAYKEKKVTLVHGSSMLVPAISSAKLHDKIMKNFEKLGVKVLLNERIAGPVGTKKSAQSFTLSNGETLNVDMVINCAGIKLLNEPLKKGDLAKSLNEKGELVVNNSHQVEGFPHIFAIGDIANIKELKNLVFAKEHAELVLKILVNLFKESQDLKDVKEKRLASKPVAVISMGRKLGAGYIKGIHLGNFVVPMIKGKDLMASKMPIQ